MREHPLHPPTTHFPIACWSIATGVDVYNRWFAAGDQQLFLGKFSVLLLAIGCAMAFLSIATGVIAFSRLPHDRSVQKAFVHMGIMALAFMLYVVSLFLRISDKHDFIVANTALIGLELVGFAVLVAGGWVGGNIVTYSHGKGTNPWRDDPKRTATKDRAPRK